MRSEFFISFVRHERFIPKRYLFDYSFFWTKFDLDELDDLAKETLLFSRNRFNFVSFYDTDHINLGKKTLKENIQAYFEEQGVSEEIRKIELVTNPRILGYTFNPVSFYFIETASNPYVLIEIGNTFNEQKPYLVRPENKQGDQWVFSTQKRFYISPFTSVENSMTFKIRRSEKHLVINIDDFNKNGELEVRAAFSGKSYPWTNKNILKLFINYPLITLRIIVSIHYHALKLFLMRIPFWKKTDDIHLQTDLYVWKDKTFKKKA